jgi:hypothetical protein
MKINSILLKDKQRLLQGQFAIGNQLKKGLLKILISYN